jgi:hypothetical protein
MANKTFEPPSGLDLGPVKERYDFSQKEDKRWPGTVAHVIRASVADVPALVAEIEALREQERHLRVDMGALKGDLEEAKAELEEHWTWADSLAAALDVPADLDPFFGIDRVARQFSQHLAHIDQTIADIEKQLASYVSKNKVNN